MKTQIILVDDHEIVREGLRSLIEKQPDMKVIGEAETGRQALHLAKKLNPDVLIMDISMPDLNGIDATAQIMAERPATRVVGLSMHADRRFLLGILKAGACGFVLKESAFAELVQAVRAAGEGEIFVSPRVAGNVIKHLLGRPSAAEVSPADKLTTREREVLQLIAEGHRTRQIAGRLNISVKTVEARRRNLMRKLDLRSVAALTKFAIREGLTDTDAS